MRKAHYHQRQGRVYYPNYQRTNTINRKKFCGLLSAGFFIFMMVFGASSVAFGSESGIELMSDSGQKTGIIDFSQYASLDGSASKAYPIKIPAGTNGIQPAISLAYNSNSGTGLAGHGWSISGLGTISRSTKDGTPKYDSSDKFLWNGQELVRADNPLPQIHVPPLYHTKRQSYVKIQGYDTPATGTASYWVVTYKNGTKYYYGNTDNSRIEAVGKGGKTRCWALAKVEDINGNYLLVSYDKSTTATDGDYYVDKIIYTFNTEISKYKCVTFNWEDRSDKRLYYSSGSRVKLNKRLKDSPDKAIEVKIGTDSSGSGGYTLNSYELAYTTEVNGKYSIESIKEYGTGSESFPVTTYSYQANSGAYIDKSSNFVPPYYLLYERLQVSPIRSYYYSGPQVADMNGDGLPDFIGGTTVYLNSGSAWDGGTWALPYGDFSFDKTGNGWRICDVNGDGLSDIVRSYKYYWDEPGYTEVIQGVYINNGNNSWTEDYYYYQETGHSTIQRGNSNWHFQSVFFFKNNHDDRVDYESGPTLADINGDGMVDFITGTTAYLNSGSGWNGGTLSVPGNFGLYEYGNGWRVSDINGDGLSDMVRSHYYYDYGEYPFAIKYKYKDVYLNQGNGSWERVYHYYYRWTIMNGVTDEDESGDGNWAPKNYFFYHTYYHRSGITPRHDCESGPTMADINGDGLVDFISGNTTYLNNGRGWNGGTWSIPGQFSFSLTEGGNDCSINDVDGDGLADFVRSFHYNPVVGDEEFIKYVFVNNDDFPNLMHEEQNSMGGKLTFAYKSSTEFSNPELPFVRQLVGSITVDDGLNATYSETTTTCDYTGGKYVGYPDREFRGFEKVIVTDPAGNKTETHYFQDDVNKGLVKKSMTRDSNNFIYDYTYNTYTDYADTSNGHPNHYGYGMTGVVYAPLLTQVDTYVVDGSTSTDAYTRPYGTTWKRLKCETTYADYGDPFEIWNYGEVDSNGDDTGYDKNKKVFLYNLNGIDFVYKPYRKSIYGYDSVNTWVTQTDEYYYYSGTLSNPDLWLNLGHVDTGHLKRVQAFKDAGNWINAKRFAYDSYGNVIKEKDANGNVHEAVYDTVYRTFPVKKIMPTVSAGTFSSYIYYDSYSYTDTDVDTISNNITRGRPVMARDINSQFTKTYYDNLGRVTDIRRPGDESGDPTIHYDYHFFTGATDPAYVKTTLKDGLGGLVSYAYSDGLGKAVQTKKEGIENETAKWIAVDNWSYFSSIYTVSETTAPYFSTTSSFTRPASPSGGRSKTASYLSNGVGKVAWFKNPDGYSSYTYSQRLVVTSLNVKNYGGKSIVDGLGNVVETRVYKDGDTYKYDDNNIYRTNKMYYNTGTGQLVKKIEDSGGANVTTTMAYDWLGRNTSSTDPDSGTWNYYYDSKTGYTSSYGNLIGQKDAKGNETKLEYDALNRVKKNDYSSGTDTYFYYDEGGSAVNENGRLTKVTDASGTTIINYDSRGHVGVVRKTISGLPAQTTRYTYDSMDRLFDITYPDLEAVRHTYGTDGNLDMLGTSSDTDKYVDDIYYDAFGRMTRLEYNYGVNHAYTAYSYYGSTGNYRLKNLTAREGDAATSNMMNFEYDYDLVGNITRIDSGNNNFYGDAHDQVFTYDNLNRLTGQTNDFYGGNSGSATSYNYDSISGIVNKNGINTYTYSGVNAGPHAVTGAAGLNYAYDANGNMRYKTENCDFDFDGDVDETDLSLFAADYGRTDCNADCQGDFDCDGDVDGTDLAVISDNIGRTNLQNASYTFDSSNRLAKVSGYATNVSMAEMAAAEEILLSEDFSNGLPSDWSVTNNNTGNIWTYDSYDGRMEIIFSSSANTEDSKLITKSMDCSYSVGTTLSFYEEWMGGYGSYWSDGYIYVSTDGGSTWIEAAHPHHCDINAPDETVSGTQTIDISSYADGESDVKIAFRYHGNYDYFWYIDNVTVRSGGLPSGYSLLSEDFSGGLPSYWSITNDGTGNTWTYSSYYGNMGIRYSSSANTEDSKLITKSIDCSSSVGTTLSFDETWKGGYGSYWSDGYVYVSTDGGSTWIEAAHPHHCDINAPDETVSGAQTIDISSYADGEPDVKIAFRYHGNYDWYWYIYNVEVKSDAGYNIMEVSGDAIAQYSYDHAGKRVKKIENGVTTYYVNQYYEVEGVTPIKYYYANGQRIAKNDGGTLTFYHADHLGGSSRITNASGEEVRRLGYKPYGSNAYSSGSGDEPYYKFTGKEQDSTGLYYYGARYYDPVLGRFISPDAYGDNYVYCNNNPLMYVDPTGNEAEHMSLRLHMWNLNLRKWQNENDFRIGVGGSLSLIPAKYRKTVENKYPKMEGTKATIVAGGYSMPNEKLANFYYRGDVNYQGTGYTGGHYLDIFSNYSTGTDSFGTQKVYNLADPGGSDSINKQKFEVKHHSGQGFKLVPAQDGKPARIAGSLTLIDKKFASFFIDIDTPIPSFIPEKYVNPAISVLETGVGMINLNAASWQKAGNAIGNLPWNITPDRANYPIYDVFSPAPTNQSHNVTGYMWNETTNKWGYGTYPSYVAP